MNDPGTETEATANGLLDDDRHYVDAVTALGDRQSIVASEDIIGPNGIKLIAKGTRIDSRLREKLSGHRLRPLLDNRLGTENLVTPESLARWAGRLFDEQPIWRHFATRSGDPGAIRQGMARLRIAPPLRFKLTVAREQRPALFAHSVRVALLAHLIGLRLSLPDSAIEKLQLAALCHDLGELHTAPAILDPKHRVTDQERQFIYVHPITGFLILKDVPGMPTEVARAVLHHHERLDGGGYPKGLSEGEIEPLAMPLMVADTAESVLSRFSDHRRLSALLRLNMRKYDERSVSALHDILIGLPSTDTALVPGNDPQPRLLALARLLKGWNDVHRTICCDAARKELAFLEARVRNLHSLLLQFGFDPDNFDTLLSLAREDREVSAELALVIDELGFQLADMSREIDRRESEIRPALGDAEQITFDDWRTTLRNSLPAA